MRITEFKLQPSDISTIIPLGQKIIIKFSDSDKIIRGESIRIIDEFSYGLYDEYEVLSIGSVKYGWLEIILAKIDN